MCITIFHVISKGSIHIKISSENIHRRKESCIGDKAHRRKLSWMKILDT